MMGPLRVQKGYRSQSIFQLIYMDWMCATPCVVYVIPVHDGARTRDLLMTRAYSRI